MADGTGGRLDFPDCDDGEVEECSRFSGVRLSTLLLLSEDIVDGEWMLDDCDASCVSGPDSESDFGVSVVSMFVTLFPNLVSKLLLALSICASTS